MLDKTKKQMGNLGVILLNISCLFTETYMKCLLQVRNYARIWAKNGKKNKIHDFMGLTVQQKNK